jgi:hypothetical protein
MAQEVAQKRALKKTLNLRITVYQDPEDNLRFKAVIKVNGWITSFGGWLDRKYIIDYLNMDLQNAWAYLGFVERANTEESRKSDLDMLRLHLEDALAHILAYEIGRDNLVTKEVICDRLWRALGEDECAYTICAGLAKEDFEACMESCKKEWCGSED